MPVMKADGSFNGELRETVRCWGEWSTIEKEALEGLLVKHQMEGGAEAWEVLEKKEEKPRDSNFMERDWEEEVLGSERKMMSGEWDLTKKRRDLDVGALAIPLQFQ